MQMVQFFKKKICSVTIVVTISLEDEQRNGETGRLKYAKGHILYSLTRCSVPLMLIELHAEQVGEEFGLN